MDDKDYRQVEDGFGKLKIPADALYGAHTQRAVENFNFTPRPMPEQFIRSLALIKKAAAKANTELNCIHSEQAEYIVKAADEIINKGYANQFPVNVFQTGSGTSTNMNMNEVIAQLAEQMATQAGAAIKVHANDHVNFGQSSNDVIPACIQLSSLLAIKQQLIPSLEHLETTLNQLASTYQQIVKTGRTHLMDAMPLSLGDEFATWAFQIAESKQRLLALLPYLAQLPLGGTAIGTGINADANFSNLVCRHLSDLTKMEIKPCENLAARISSQDVSVQAHNELKLLATIYIKLSNDLRWMNSGPNSGLSELQLKALQPGSSIMPGKVNPVIPEAIIMMACEVIGNDTSIMLANQSGNFQLNVMLPLVADKLITSITLLTDASQAFADKALHGFEVNEQKLAKQAKANPILATALNPIIGYDKAAKIAKKAMQENLSIIEVAREMTDIPAAELEQILEPIQQAKPHGK